MADKDDASVSNLFNEIDEELRQDKAALLWKQYGNTFIAAIIAVIIAVAGYEGWKAYDISSRSELGQKYADALNLSNKDQHDNAIKSFKTLAGEGSNGYATLARLQEASILAKQGKKKDAAQAYFLIGQNGEINKTYRDMAMVLGALNGLDDMDAKDIITRLQGLVGSSSPWRFSASEITAFAEAKAGNKTKAAEIMKALADDAGAPPSLRQRAAEFAQAYGG